MQPWKKTLMALATVVLFIMDGFRVWTREFAHAEQHDHLPIAIAVGMATLSLIWWLVIRAIRYSVKDERRSPGSRDPRPLRPQEQARRSSEW